MRAEELIDKDDWVEVEKIGKQAPVLADVTVKITIAAIGRNAKGAKAHTAITFRGAAAEWVEANGPRFRIEVGGRLANYMRIVPDLHRGKFEVFDYSRGGGLAKGIKVGVLTAWPAEERVSTEAAWSVTDGFMKLRLPDDFAVARSAAKSAPESLAALGGRLSVPVRQPAPTVRIDELTTAYASPARSTNVVAMSGEPEPSRSALAVRR